MDIDKLFKKVLDSEDVKNIPVLYVITVLNCVLDAIGSGECFYKNEQEIT